MKLLKPLFLSALSLLFIGCTGYQVGSTLPDSIQSVSLKVVNDTDEPSIEVQVMKSLREELQMDGRLELRRAGDADTVLEVTLTGYHLSPLAYDRTRGDLAREYNAVISARSVLYYTGTTNVVRETVNLSGVSDFSYDDDLTTTKLLALDGAADDLSRKIINLTITEW